MHSLIFQITSQKKRPVEFIASSDYDTHEFLHTVADYVLELEDRTAAIKNFTGDGIKTWQEGEDFFFMVTDKKAFFENRYKAFQTALTRAQSITLEEFAGRDYKVYAAVYDIKHNYDNEYGYYVEDGGEYAGLQTLDAFIRHAEEGKPYFIGGVLDYHF